MDVRAALAHARAAGVDRLDAQWLLAHLLQHDRSWLLAHDDARLDDSIAAAFGAGIARRAAGEPLAYVIGRAVFRGLELEVSPAVLIPRPETEVLVEWALEHCTAGLEVIDLGTGSGAVALAIARGASAVQVTATDLSDSALEVAQRNAQRLRLPLRFAQGSWWGAVPGRRFGLAVSNPPYVAAADPHLEALRHEPALALTPGDDGLRALRELIAGAAAHLLPGAWLLLEHGHDQAGAISALLEAADFRAVQTRCDLAGLARCTGGRLSSADAPDGVNN
jgi:release factor glutamine methyltransferase